MFSNICKYPHLSCEHKPFSIGNYTHTCSKSYCIFDPLYYNITNMTKIIINGQDNKTTMNDDTEYTICPHCGHKIYKEK